MRKRHPVPPPLRGQLLFAQHRDDRFTVDCLLTSAAGGPGAPVTFMVRFPNDTVSASRALELLGAWAERATPVDVTVSSGRTGPQVEIATPEARVVLEPDPVSVRGH